MKILLVEDDLAFAQKCTEALLRANYDVSFVADAVSARLLLANNNYDLFIIDLMLPPSHGLEGLDLLKFLKMKGINAPTIMITSKAFKTTNTVSEAMKIGASDFIDKDESFFTKRLLASILEINIPNRDINKDTKNSNDLETLPAEAPPALKQIRWMLLYGKKHLNIIILAAIILGVFFLLKTVFIHQNQKVSDLRLVDVSIEESDNSFPKIDIKLRNLGTEVVFLKKGVLRVIDKGILRDSAIVDYLSVAVSWNYDILLGDEKQIEKPISHSIQPNAVDRFTFTLAHDGGDRVFPTLFYIEVSLVYNEDDKTLIFKPLLIPVPSTMKAIAATTSGYDRGIAIANINLLKRFAAYEGIKSETFRKMMKKYKKPEDFMGY